MFSIYELTPYLSRLSIVQLPYLTMNLSRDKLIHMQCFWIK